MHKLFLACILILIGLTCELFGADPISTRRRSSNVGSARYGIGGLGGRSTSALTARGGGFSSLNNIGRDRNSVVGMSGLGSSLDRKRGGQSIFSNSKNTLIGNSHRSSFTSKINTDLGSRNYSSANYIGRSQLEGVKPADIGKYKPEKLSFAPKDSEIKGDIRHLDRDILTSGDWDRNDALKSDLKSVHEKMRQENPNLLNPNSYLEALYEEKDTVVEREIGVIEKDSSKVTTLVPQQQTQLREMMLKGEKAFKDEMYGEAVDHFKLAQNFAPNSPEISLSLFNCAFASNRGLSYGMAAYYLRRSFKQFPELAVVDVHPKYFYKSSEGYVRDLTKLENYLVKNSKDPDAIFVMAYMQWRDGKPEQTKQLLKQVFRAVDDKEFLEAVDIFWDGISAAGKADGKIAQIVRQEDQDSLQPASNPAEDK